MPDLDHVLAPHRSRERSEPPYPLVLEGELDTLDGERFLRVDSASLWGPVTGAEGLLDGTFAVVVLTQEGIPYVVYPNVGVPGPKGDKGDKGDTGATGPPGPMAHYATYREMTTP